MSDTGKAVERPTLETITDTNGRIMDEIHSLGVRATHLLERFGEHIPEDPEAKEDTEGNPILRNVQLQTKILRDISRINEIINQVENQVGFFK